MNDRDLDTARNVLRKVSHRPREEQETILREWFGRKATPDFIAAAMAKAATA
jgi:hypothetical protein